MEQALFVYINRLRSIAGLSASMIFNFLEGKKEVEANRAAK